MIKKISCKRKRDDNAERAVSEDDMYELARKLKEAGDSVVEKSIGLRMLGSDDVCNSSMINEICKHAHCI